jgi:hypothetical protein
MYDDVLQKHPRASLPTGFASPREATGSSRSPRRDRRPHQRSMVSSFPGDGSLDPARGALAPNPPGPRWDREGGMLRRGWRRLVAPRRRAVPRVWELRHQPNRFSLGRARHRAIQSMAAAGRRSPPLPVLRPWGARPSFASTQRNSSSCNAAARRSSSNCLRALLGVGVVGRWRQRDSKEKPQAHRSYSPWEPPRKERVVERMRFGACWIDKIMLSDFFSPPYAATQSFTRWWFFYFFTWSMWTSVCHIVSNFQPASQGRLIGFFFWNKR